MTGPRSPRSATLWIQRADHDLRAAVHLLTLDEDCPFEAVCFHAQQCVEKYLKALLLVRGRSFPPTHDLGHLLTLMAPADHEALVGLQPQALNSYAVEGRYPGDWDPLERSEAEAGVDSARAIRAAVRTLLGEADA